MSAVEEAMVQLDIQHQTALEAREEVRSLLALWRGARLAVRGGSRHQAAESAVMCDAYKS
jgi:hypothetical protein